MGDPEPIDQILKKIKKKWDEDKEDWKVVSNIDKDGNQEMFISHAPNTWWLKMKQINAYQNMAYGFEVRNIDDEINKKIISDSKKKHPMEMLHFFGMMVPSDKEIIYSSGVGLHSPRIAQAQKEKIETKQANADKSFRKYIRKKWEKEYFDREQMYI